MSRSEYIYVIKCTSWLAKFLTHRGLKITDSRPLFEYHSTSDEYEELKRLLCDVGKAEGLKNDKGYAACFTLFCAEWYRREYERIHGWSWEPIYKVLGLSLSAPELSHIVPKGLEDYWRRPVRFYDSERRNFLGSLFSEGGLPFKLLKESDSRFHSVFSRILNQYDQSISLGYSTLSVVQAVVDRSMLPTVFKEDTSVELIGRMADQLISLVQAYDLINHSEPVKELDRVHPKWRDSFPMPLDDATGTSFLNGLLRTATVETKPRLQKNKTTGCSFFWSEQNPDDITAHIFLPNELPFAISSDPSTTRFELTIYEDDEEVASLGPAYARLEKMQATVRLRKSEVRFVRQQTTASLSLVARAGGIVVGTIKLDGSEIAVGDVPLIFVRDEERWLLQGQASCNVRSSDVLIILPAEGHLASNHGDCSSGTRALGHPALSIKGRQDVIFEGNETYRIRTGREQVKHPDLALQGNKLAWLCSPYETFVGIPRVIHQFAAAQSIGYERFLSGKNINRCDLHETMGAHYISIRNEDNETLLRRKVGILPSDFQLEIKSREQANEGVIIISTQHPCLYRLKDKTLEVGRSKSANKTEIMIKAESVPPTSVVLQVTPNLAGNPIDIILPFPTKGCLVLDVNGQHLPKNITINDLLGTRAFLFGKNGEPARFRLELRLMSRTRQLAWHEWRYTATEHPVELNLYSLREHIENLLSLETGIDQMVEMRIDGAGSVLTWQIRRYKYSLSYDHERQILLTNSVNTRSGLIPSPVIMLLSEPERKSVSLTSRMSEGVPVGEFELSSVIQKNGPWLVVPGQGEETAFRPCFIRGEPPLQTEVHAIQSMQKATQLFNPRSNVNTITLVLDQMASDPAHSGWQFLRSLYDHYGYLPLATFEVWRALVQHPRALAMSLFKFEMSVEYLSRIENEFPVFWEFLPVLEIKGAADRFRAFLNHKGAPEEMHKRLLNRMYQQLGTIFPTYANEVQEWLSLGIQPRPIPHQMMREIIQDWYQALLREHSESRWPEYGGAQLCSWIMSQKDSVIDISPDTEYRYSVVCLPVFAAAVASGKTTFESVFGHEPGTLFFLRQVRDFDSRWFNAIFQYSLLRNVAEK
ncbi:STY4851/ECs_5259 family protein [Serratia proteamaculans]|uniref:STY4851/ECs_5259 family protein n=1 Tax=Serratia proteamaculans TaxID=28151 RepID=UPI0039BE2C79